MIAKINVIEGMQRGGHCCCNCCITLQTTHTPQAETLKIYCSKMGLQGEQRGSRNQFFIWFLLGGLIATQRPLTKPILSSANNNGIGASQKAPVKISLRLYRIFPLFVKSLFQPTVRKIYFFD